jgi:hypothetical protein
MLGIMIALKFADTFLVTVKESCMDRNHIAFSQQDYPIKVVERRRNPRRLMHIPSTVADKHGLTNGVVTNISEAGCRLKLVISSVPSRYLTLKLYPQNGSPTLLITMAEIKWVEKEWVGLGFVYLSQEDQTKLQRLCREHVTLGQSA